MRSVRTGASLCVVAFLLLAGTPCASGQSQRMRAVRPPVQRSSEERIDAALAAGQIDSETALLYKVFAAFGDCRLPASLAGDAGPLMDSMIIAEVRARFSQLSAATKATLQPFLLAPGGKRTQLTPESKRPGRFRCQPGIPGIRSDDNRSLLLTRPSWQE